MSAFETIEVPFIQVGNRQCLIKKQLMEDPRLQEFINRFPTCFERDPCCEVYWYYPDGDFRAS